MTAGLGEYVFATDERPLPEIVLDLLRARAGRPPPPSRAPAGWWPRG